MSELDYGIFDCDTHMLRAARRVHPVPAQGVSRPGDHAGARGRRQGGDPRRAPHRHVQQRGRAGLRPRLPPGLAEGDAQADGVGQPRRDLRARADAARVPRARAAAEAARAAGRRALRAVPGRHGAGRRALRRRHRRAVRQPARRSTAGSTRRGASTTRTRIYATALLSLRDLDRAIAVTDDDPRPAAPRSCCCRPGPAYGRCPGDPYFDPIWSRLQRGRRARSRFHIMPYWYFDAISPAWGHDPDPAVVAHVGVAVDEHLRRAPDRWTRCRR